MTKDYRKAAIEALLKKGAVSLEQPAPIETIRTEDFGYRVLPQVIDGIPTVILEFTTTIRWVAIPLDRAKALSKALIAASKEANRIASQMEKENDGGKTITSE